MNLPRRSSAVVLREVEEGAILFSTESEMYFSLNVVGLRVWHLLASDCRTVDEVVATIQGEYPDINRELIATDVLGLLNDLGGNGLVEFKAAS